MIIEFLLAHSKSRLYPGNVLTRIAESAALLCNHLMASRQRLYRSRCETGILELCRSTICLLLSRDSHLASAPPTEA